MMDKLYLSLIWISVFSAIIMAEEMRAKACLTLLLVTITLLRVDKVTCEEAKNLFPAMQAFGNRLKVRSEAAHSAIG